PRAAGGLLRRECRPRAALHHQRPPAPRRGRGRMDPAAARPAAGGRFGGLRGAVARTHERPPAAVLLLGAGRVLGPGQRQRRPRTGETLPGAARRALERLTRRRVRSSRRSPLSWERLQPRARPRRPATAIACGPTALTAALAAAGDAAAGAPGPSPRARPAAAPPRPRRPACASGRRR